MYDRKDWYGDLYLFVLSTPTSMDYAYTHRIYRNSESVLNQSTTFTHISATYPLSSPRPIASFSAFTAPTRRPPPVATQ
jgi:hypothetical protein